MVVVPQANATNGTPGGSCTSGEEFCLDKTASPNPVNLGEPLIFTITFTNNSAIQAPTPVDLQDELPTSVSFESLTGTASPVLLRLRVRTVALSSVRLQAPR
ncbi:MAG: DUF11 domain-containing protein [Actinobacteria bacterium]|nr:DUF11 domain-containing protein [Actinomycetota bacterium]MCA1740459.1 DUF11 domain-containing protein [Actinomycetota bacterium]